MSVPVKHTVHIEQASRSHRKWAKKPLEQAICLYAWQSDRSIVAIDCTAAENVEAENLCQRSGLDYLIWNDPTAYADLILNGDPKKYLRAVTVY